MATDKTKKELRAGYLERTVTGGVFAIRNERTGEKYIDISTDLQGTRNRFTFMTNTGAAYNPKMQKDFDNGDTFAFEIIEELEKGKTQTDAEFKADLALLREQLTVES
jgi:hypothetical protein